jgi:hypothetical protein
MAKGNYTDEDRQRIKDAYAILNDKPTWDSKTGAQQTEIIRTVLVGIVGYLKVGTS